MEVYTGREWHPARVLQRHDRRGVTTYHVMVTLDPDVGSPVYRSYAWDPASIRPVRPATVDPVERTWS